MYDDIVAELNTLKLSKCENIKIGDMMKNHFIFSESLSSKFVLPSIFRIMVYSFFSSDVAWDGNPNVISLNFLRNRKDHIEAFKKVTDLLQNQLIVNPQKMKLCISNIKCFYLPFLWVKQMHECSCKLHMKLIMASALYKAYMTNISIEKVVKKNSFHIKYLITYADVSEDVGNYMTQVCNNEEIITIALQHGFYDVSINSWFYAGSKSKYFLADSPASKDFAKKVGYKGCVIPVGSPHQINENAACSPVRNIDVKIVGIIMNAPDYNSADNISMIKTVQEYAKNKNKKVILKFHPANHREDYLEYIDTSVTQMLERETTIDEFTKMTDIVVVCKSTVFTTMLRKGKSVLLFYPLGTENYMFANTEFIRFSSSEELEQKLSKINSEEYLEEYKKYQSYFLCPGNYKENYIKFFKEIGMIDN